MIHPKALEAIKRYLNEALNGCQIEKGWPIYESLFGAN
jgi:succinylglutamate desuccinylase